MGENSASKTSIMADMDKTAELINSYFYRLEKLERNLKFKPMTNEERETTEKDVAELKGVLLKEENRLRVLRKENRGSAYVAVILIILAFLFFGVYKMYTNPAIVSSNIEEDLKIQW